VHLHAKYIAEFERTFGEMKKVYAIMELILTLGCDDSRQGKNIAALGGILTKKEFEELIKNIRDCTGPKAEVLIYKPHFKCGFLGACIGISAAFKTLEKALYDEMKAKKDRAADRWNELKKERAEAVRAKDTAKTVIYSGITAGDAQRKAKTALAWADNKIRELDDELAIAAEAVRSAEYDYKRNLSFFRGSVAWLLKHEGSVRETELAPPFLPGKYKSAYSRYRAQDGKLLQGQADDEAWKMAGFVFNVFVTNDEMMRGVIRRGVDVGVLQFNGSIRIDENRSDANRLHGKQCLVSMPSADFIDAEIAGETVDAAIRNMWITEEVARRTFARYVEWVGGMKENQKVGLLMMTENFRNGRHLKVPEKFSKGTVRTDAILDGFSPEMLDEVKIEKTFDIAELAMPQKP